MQTTARTISLVKDGHRFVYRCGLGQEPELLAHLVSEANDPESPLDWFDAAVLSYQLGQQMERSAEVYG